MNFWQITSPHTLLEYHNSNSSICPHSIRPRIGVTENGLGSSRFSSCESFFYTYSAFVSFMMPRAVDSFFSSDNSFVLF